MAYTINKTNGSVLTTVADGTIDNSTDLTLVGKNYSGYGEILNENFVKLMENFASTSQPASPLAGQLWWDITNGVLKVYSGTGFKAISGSTASASQPATATLGDLWFDTFNRQLRVYNGTSWTLIGPNFTAGTGTSGGIVTSVTDSQTAPHVVILFYVNEVVVATLSKDSTFTPQTNIAGFPNIGPGLQLSNSTSMGAQFRGTVSNASTLNSLTSSQFMRTDSNTTTSGTLGVLNDGGVTIGADLDLRLTVSGADSLVTSNTADGDIIFRVNKSAGGITEALRIDGQTGAVTVSVAPPANDNSNRLVTTAYLTSALAGFTGGGGGGTTDLTGYLKADGTVQLTGSLIPAVSNTRDLGSPTRLFADIYCTNLNGTAVRALYADLAERFEADSAYEPGTVVELGGEKEITAVSEELSDRVFGVVSTQAAFLMNGGAGDDATHPAIAMTGRVPVKVVGKVTKGDRLVSAGNGMARAAQPGEANSFNVLGRALESKSTETAGTVLAVVKVQ